MQPYRLPFADTHRFAPLVLDHLAEDPFVASLRVHAPTWEGLEAAARARTFSMEARAVLLAVLGKQYEGMEKSDRLIANLNKLAQQETLTITTGHQLCLFTGPLYVPLKILNTIKAANSLSEKLGRPVVPVFWMATEDHDRPEIDHAWVRGEKIQWPGEIGGAVGELSMEGIDTVLNELENALGPGRNAEQLMATVRQCFRPEHTLKQATRLFVNELFGQYGIICLDASDRDLKRLFVPIMRKELQEQFVQRSIRAADQELANRYRVQAHARDINLFHLSAGRRDRIVGSGKGQFKIEGGATVSREQLLAELEEYPERFSPNVLLRPLYQECILPNVAYIGGGGELAYWLQLKDVFDQAGLPMPALLMRSSAAILPHKEFARVQDLGFTIPELFLPKYVLQARIAREKAGFSTSFEDERAALQQIFERTKGRARSIDPTLERSAGSSADLALKGLGHLEKRFVRAAKARTQQEFSRLDLVMEILFPGGGMQERKENFMTFFVRHGWTLFEVLLEQLDPLEQQFTVLVEEALDSGRMETDQ